ncbi:hypothetical protein, partial [Vibrio vulnificus]
AWYDKDNTRFVVNYQNVTTSWDTTSAVAFIQLFSCNSDEIFNPETAKCEAKPDCAETAQGVVIPEQSWPYKVYGDNPRVCAKQCIFRSSTV